MVDFWKYNDPISTYTDAIEIPDWIIDPTPADIEALLVGGCSSGAYMPAVTYWQASKTMAEHGDEVLTFIEDYGDLPEIPRGESWSGIAVLFLSHAVELWSSVVADELRDALEALEAAEIDDDDA